MKVYACLLWALSLAVLGEGFLFVALLDSPCPKSKDPVLIPHRKCSHFYICSAGRLQVMQCPLGLHFNKKLQICEHPDMAGCEVNQPFLQGTYPRGTYETQQQDNYDKIFPAVQTLQDARPAKYPSGPYADA